MGGHLQTRMAAESLPHAKQGGTDRDGRADSFARPILFLPGVRQSARWGTDTGVFVSIGNAADRRLQHGRFGRYQRYGRVPDDDSYADRRFPRFDRRRYENDDDRGFIFFRLFRIQKKRQCRAYAAAYRRRNG